MCAQISISSIWTDKKSNSHIVSGALYISFRVVNVWKLESKFWPLRVYDFEPNGNLRRNSSKMECKNMANRFISSSLFGYLNSVR